MKLDAHCFNHQYGSYENVQDAKDACNRDVSCKGIYDSGCDNGGGNKGVYLCERGYYDYEPSSSSCVYDKSGAISNYFQGSIYYRFFIFLLTLYKMFFAFCSHFLS